VDVLLVPAGAIAADVLAAAESVRGAGFSVRVAAPGWVNPIDASLVDLARDARLVVTVEDGSVIGGVGTRIAQALTAGGVATPVRQLGVPDRFPKHGSVADVKAWAGLSVQDIGRRIVEAAVVVIQGESGEPDVAAAPGKTDSARE
jgi:1-deoxy-D-xylulose-5-phosphate synthase